MNNLIQIYSSIKKEQKPIVQFLEREKANFASNNFKRYKNKEKPLIIIYFLAFAELIYSLWLQSFALYSFCIYKNLFDFFDTSKIYYEESSWFDIRIYQKVNFLIKNDKIFLNFKVKKQSRNLWKSLYKNLIYLFLFFALYFLIKY